MGEGDFVQRVGWPTCRLVLHLLTITLDPEFSDTLEGNTVTLLLVCLTFGIRITSLPFGNNRATRNV